MASACKRRLSTNEKRGVRQDLDSWRSRLIQCVGTEKILELLLGTRILEDLRLFKDYKPASVSNWSFDENCLFCCLRREKVKEHVVALNNKIVESGGKPLLGKDQSNISRLEWQVEEFLNAVLHRKEYTPRIPDPHIPVVACDTMQQMTNQLVVHYTNTNSQGSPQRSGNMDQSLLRTCSVTPPTVAATATATAAAAAATAQNPVLSKLLMPDQDAPLDLSVKKVKPEVTEQDGVLDLSIKKTRNSDSTSLQSPQKTFTKPFVARDSLDLDLDLTGRDLQSASKLEQFMAKLCLHHQRQVVDAFGFLQTEVKAVSSYSTFQACSPTIPEKPTTSGSSHVMFEERTRNQGCEEMQDLSVALSTFRVQESPFVKSDEFSHAELPLKTEGSPVASVETGPFLDITKTSIGDEDSASSDVVAAESRNIDVQPKCPTLLIVKNRSSGSLEAKNLMEEGAGNQHVNSGMVDQDLCTSDTRLQASCSESDVIELSSSMGQGHSDAKCCAVERGSITRSCTVERTSNVISPNSPRTARKSGRVSHSLLRDSSGCHIINGPDITCDIVYVGKPITECEHQSHIHMTPRKNARKSTRGFRYIGGCCELKTVRTLARKSAENGSGNCPVPMPEMTTSVAPKQALAKPDGVPPVDILFTADCMETVIHKKPSDQPEETEVPEDVMASEDVETSQTDQTQSTEKFSCPVESEQSDTSVQQELNAGICESVADSNDVGVHQGDLVDSIVTDINVAPQEVELTTKETLDFSVSGVTQSGLETEDQDQNVATEALQSPLSSGLAKDDASDTEGVCVERGVLTEALEQTECVDLQVMTSTDKSADIEITCGTETNLKPGDDIEPTQDKDKEKEAGTSDLSVEEMITKEQHEECKGEGLVPNTLDGSSPKKVVKTVAPSNRCLRNRVSKGTSEQTMSSNAPGQMETQSDSPDKNQSTPESKRHLKTSKSKHVEENVPCQDGQYNLNPTENLNLEKTQRSPVVTQRDGVDITDNMVCTRQKQKLMMEKEIESSKEQNVLEPSTPKDEDKVQGQDSVSDDIPENMEVTPPKIGESPGKSLRSSERISLRNGSHQIEQPVKVSASPIKNSTQPSERMPLRNRNSSAVDQPTGGESSSSPTGGRLERLGRMPLRSRDSYNAEHIVKDSCISPSRSGSDSVGRMPLRSRNSSTVNQHVSGGSDGVIKDVSSSLTEQSSSDLVPTSRRTESAGHMPLRSGNASVAEQPSRNTLSVGNVSESPGRMSLRRSNVSVAEKMDSSATPPKSMKSSQRPPRSVKTSVPPSILEGEQSPKSVKLKTDKLLKDQAKDSSLSDNSVSVTLRTTTPVTPSTSKFLEALNGEENQHLISELNTKFDKMQKGWVQMDKEGQPAPRPKNKADRLKEIWKSKRRIRKPRSLEQQKFSPVQMLFMKSFDLPSICRWFLQSTETKSLVIVKKVNTRLPSETQLCFHTSAAVPGASNGVFPSVQAERLKKHLKKFAIASPVKSNPKNKRLIAKALAQGISVSKGKEKREPSTATRISTKPHSYTGLIQPQPSESHGKVTANAKNPASARILRKYSNMREKMQVQQNTLKKLESSLDKAKKVRVMPKNVSKAMSAGKGQRSAIVKKVKALAKKAKVKSAVKEKTPKSSVSRSLRGLKDRAGIPAKKALTKVSETNVAADTKSPTRKDALPRTSKSPQTKADVKKSHSPKGREGLTSPSQTADVKPAKSEDQVLTRSQRKIEATLAQIGSPKTATKRGSEPLSTPAKRTRTSK
uniref:Ligand-dependent corepressor n=2 Tax=Pygocentrus nattereri TaxID=42514 RepID=A0AAR2JCR9_PYGNA